MDASKGIGRARIGAETPRTMATEKKNPRPDIKMQGLGAHTTPSAASTAAAAGASLSAAISTSSSATVLIHADATTSTAQPAEAAPAKRCIKLMADFSSYPLWEASPGQLGDIDPRSLPIKPALQKDLMFWASMYDATLNRDDPGSSGFKTPQKERDFQEIGRWLAFRLQQELPDVEVLIHHGLQSE